MIKSIARVLPDDINLRHNLFLEWIVINGFGTSLFAVAVFNGWIEQMMEVDKYFILPTIFFVFLWGLVTSAIRALQLSGEITKVRKNPESSSLWCYYRSLVENSSELGRSSVDRALEIRQSSKLFFFQFIRSALVMMGFIGTLVGLMIATGQINPEAFGNVNTAGSTMAAFIQNYSLALYTTILGGITWLWTSYNYSLLTKGVAQLVASVYEAKSTKGNTDVANQFTGG